ncbi:polyribonucleotide nucleotidyltransferase [bacterium]|nr:polyribonucleotide nucleotidyltransferase [bacterium]
MYSKEIEIEGKKLVIETGKIAKQADGSVTVRSGDTIILATVVASDSVRENADFFPLTVDYREKVSAAGRIPGGYIKREGRPTEKEILTCRLTDRPIRPLFPDGFYNEVQIMLSVLSADGENDPDVLAMIGASSALVLSDIPFEKAVGAVRVGTVEGEFVINPTSAQLENSTMNIIVAGTKDGICMVEGESHNISEATLLEAIFFAHENIKKIVALQNELRDLCGKEKRDVADQLITVDEALYETVSELVYPKIEEVINIPEKLKRQDALGSLKKDAVKSVLEKDADTYTELQIKQAFKKIEKNLIRRMILDKGIRSDGRGFKDIRPITCEVGLLPRTHGSALFTRGETQALVMTTLGSPGDEQRYEGLDGEHTKAFMLHYNFPPFSVGECRPVRGPGRREIGHGFLAERALSYILPEADKFPYVIRIISDILESNGSSSMASVCGGTLSLMDAGVPIKTPVAGIAMGLVAEGDKIIVLSDILGSEDGAGDMDFKVTGTEEGITAFQMDLKIDGITNEIMEKALYQAREGRMHILNEMKKAISEPREDVCEYAPRIITMQIDQEKIGALIGPGGKNVKRIIEETKVTINIEDDGKVHIASNDKDSIAEAVKQVELLTAEAEVGKDYKGTVKTIQDFGAFVEILPGKEGLIHISRLAETRIASPREVVDVGDKVDVRVFEIDDRGRINLELLVDGNPVAKNRPSHSRDKNHNKGGFKGHSRRDQHSRPHKKEHNR